MAVTETNSEILKKDNKSSKKKTSAPATAFSFKEKAVLESGSYSVALPDDFSYKKEYGIPAVQGQEIVDFIAWSPASAPVEKWEDSRIAISAAGKSEDIRYALKDGIEAFKAAFEALPGIKENSRETECYREEDGQKVYCYIRRKINGKRTSFCCIAGDGAELRQFTIRFNTGLSKEKMERSVLEWLKKVEIKAALEPAAEEAQPEAEIAETVVEQPEIVEPQPEIVEPAPEPDPQQLLIDSLKRKLVEADAELVWYKNKRAEAAKKLEEAERAYSRLLSDKLIEEESTKLQIRSIEAKAAEKENAIAELKRRRRDLRAQKEEYRKDISNLEPERKAKSKEIDMERKALEEKLNLLADEKAEIQEEKADKKSKLQGVFLFKKKKQQEYNEVKSRLKEKNSEISACDEEIESLNAKVAELKANTEKERDRLNGEIKRLEFEEKEVHREITGGEEELKKIAKEKTMLQEKIRDYQLSKANAAKEMTECKRQYDVCDADVCRYEADRKRIVEELQNNGVYL